MILAERDIDSDYEIMLEYHPDLPLQIFIQDKANHITEWYKEVPQSPDAGKLALEIFYHPFVYGFGLDR